MTRVVFENATFRDVIGKAAKIAPTKGSAFDKAAGIHITVLPDANEVLIRANNTEVFYTEITEPVSIEGPETVILVRSTLLDAIASKLPVTSGAQVSLETTGRQLSIVHRRMKAHLPLMDPSHYTLWQNFDSADLSVVSDFAGRLQQVSWAAARDSVPPLNGIHLDGKYAIATDRQRIAITPCEAEMIYEPVTIPSSTFTPLMKNLGEVKMGRNDNTLLLMPDESTQISATIYAGKFPALRNLFNRAEPQSVMLRREEIVEMIEQAMVMGVQDRNPVLKVIVGFGEFAVMMEDVEMGLLGNVAELPNQCSHDRFKFGLSPDSFISALRAAPNKDVSLHYNIENPKKPVRLDGGSGYEVLLMTKSLEPNKEQ